MYLQYKLKGSFLLSSRYQKKTCYDLIWPPGTMAFILLFYLVPSGYIPVQC